MKYQMLAWLLFFAFDSAALVCPPAQTTPDQITIKNDPNEPLVDHNRGVKDFCTEFVVKEFFKSNATLFNFYEITINSMEDAINAYRTKHGLDDKTIFFLVKGGNVMRFGFKNITDLLQTKTREHYTNAYADVFKRSDADFGVFTNPSPAKLKNLDFKMAIKELGQIAKQTLDKLRDEFDKNPKKYFDLMQLSPNDANKVFAEYLSKANELPVLADKDNPRWFGAKIDQFQMRDYAGNPDMMCKYEGNRDLQFEYANNNKSEIIATALTRNGHWIQNSLNRTLAWGGEVKPQLATAFDLDRAKAGCELVITPREGQAQRKTIGGELIDVSLAKDLSTKEFIDNADVLVADYSITSDEGKVLKFKAESFPGIAEDLNGILYRQNDRPWNDAKYEKRIKRIMFWASTDILTTFGTGSPKITEFISAVRNDVVKPLREFYPPNAKKALALKEAANAIAKKYPELPKFNHLLESSAKLADVGLLNNPKEDDQEKLKEFLDVVDVNLDTIGELVNMPKEIIDIKKAYHGKIGNLL